MISKLEEVNKCYLIFPLITLLTMRIKNKLINYIITLYFIIFIGFSQNGVDYYNYENIFNRIKEGVKFSQVHGELVFKKYMSFFNSYENFRVFHLVLFLSIICYCLYKLSYNYIFSIFILYCAYEYYLFSLYRQLISMALVFVGIYLMKKNKINSAILFNIFGCFFHISSILPVVFFIYFKFKRKIEINKKILWLSLFISFLLRGIVNKFSPIFIYLLDTVGRGNHFKFYIEYNSYFAIGVLIRFIPALVILLFYESKNKIYDKIFYMYIFTIFIYFMIPFRGVMGRLTDNGKILESLLLPYLYMIQIKKINRIMIFIYIVVYFGGYLLYLRLIGGNMNYYPYINLLIK